VEEKQLTDTYHN